MSPELNEKTGHTPGGILRGGKYSRYDGGMHVPFIIQWKGTVKPGVSDAVVCQVDFLASFAKMLQQETPKNVDSTDILDAFLGRSPQGRTELVLEAGRRLSFRSGHWFLVPPAPARNAQANSQAKAELFDLKADPSQQNNIAADHPDVVEALTKRLRDITQ
jgi:arylsulfatase A-like enzyme